MIRTRYSTPSAGGRRPGPSHSFPSAAATFRSRCRLHKVAASVRSGGHLFAEQGLLERLFRPRLRAVAVVLAARSRRVRCRSRGRGCGVAPFGRSSAPRPHERGGRTPPDPLSGRASPSLRSPLAAVTKPQDSGRLVRAAKVAWVAVPPPSAGGRCRARCAIPARPLSQPWAWLRSRSLRSLLRAPTPRAVARWPSHPPSPVGLRPLCDPHWPR